ncbi:zinc finger protein 726-like [Argiope bruennichi]|uniref:zinc finger protein 726-like n=1 Tax=Argiope bruennichi TaxID=94029 RepID=UPI0024946D9E|nr:zinc finger protein 726-like [Argiope bruennichi]
MFSLVLNIFIADSLLFLYIGVSDLEYSRNSDGTSGISFTSLRSSDKSDIYQCDACSYSSRFLGNLKRHYLIHTGQRPYVCSFCGKAFNQKVTLTTHKRLHTGERPYPCSKCPLRFHNRASLIRHFLKHEEQSLLIPVIEDSGTILRTYKCPFCPPSLPHTEERQFAFAICLWFIYSNIIISLLIPGGDVLKMLTFSSRKRIINGRYRCSSCSYSTNYFSNLKRHNLVHTGECPFSCNVCGRSFNQKDSLKRHFTIHFKTAM